MDTPKPVSRSRLSLQTLMWAITILALGLAVVHQRYVIVGQARKLEDLELRFGDRVWVDVVTGTGGRSTLSFDAGDFILHGAVTSYPRRENLTAEAFLYDTQGSLIRRKNCVFTPGDEFDAFTCDLRSNVPPQPGLYYIRVEVRSKESKEYIIGLGQCAINFQVWKGSPNVSTEPEAVR